MTSIRILRMGILGLLLAMGGLAAPREGQAFSTCYGCVGWDGSGLGAAALNYYFGSLTHDNGLTDQQVKTTALSAMQTWSRVADVTWTETSQAGQLRSIDLNWTTGTYSPYAFSWGQRTLAVSFTPRSAEPLAGDIYLNDAFTWATNGGYGFDIFSVALHEMGHALGLGHSTNRDAVMYPYYHRVTGLHADDIAGILSLYAATPAPPPSSETASLSDDQHENLEAIPEPGTFLLMGSGLASLGMWLRRRRMIKS